MTSYAAGKASSRSLVILAFIILLLTACAERPRTGFASTGISDRPNFIFILGDDVGILDINAYSRRLANAPEGVQLYETPHLDRLVHDGVAFEQAYAAQLCSPTRAALLTGRFAPRLGFTSATPPTRTYFSGGVDAPAGEMPLDTIEQKTPVRMMVPLDGAHTLTGLPTGHPLDLGTDILTIAEALDDYRSAYLGKWHLGGHGAPGHAPRDNGFEELAWSDAGASPYFDWRGEWERVEPHFDTSPVARLNLGSAGPAGRDTYLTDDLTTRAVDFIEQQGAAERPFLLYFAHFAVHTPMEAPASEVGRFAAKPQIGWKGQRNAIYGAMLARLDASIGRIREALEEAGLSDNTYIIFMSDNGGVDWQVGAGAEPLRIAPGDSYEGDPPPTSNAPFRGGKATIYEGGVRVPLIVYGPRAQGGRWIGQPVDMTDIFPTLYHLSGREPDRHYSDPGFDGRSLVSLLDDTVPDAYSKDAIYWHYPFNVVVPDPTDGLPGGPVSAMRQGPYKIVVRWGRDVQLYDIERDPFERNDLAGIETETKERMCSQLTDWLRANVAPQYFPQSNPAYDPELDPRGPSQRLNDLIDFKQEQLSRPRRSPVDGTSKHGIAGYQHHC